MRGHMLINYLGKWATRKKMTIPMNITAKLSSSRLLLAFRVPRTVFDAAWTPLPLAADFPKRPLRLFNLLLPWPFVPELAFRRREVFFLEAATSCSAAFWWVPPTEVWVWRVLGLPAAAQEPLVATFRLGGPWAKKQKTIILDSPVKGAIDASYFFYVPANCSAVITAGLSGDGEAWAPSASPLRFSWSLSSGEVVVMIAGGTLLAVAVALMVTAASPRSEELLLGGRGQRRLRRTCESTRREIAKMLFMLYFLE